MKHLMFLKDNQEMRALVFRQPTNSEQELMELYYSVSWMDKLLWGALRLIFLYVIPVVICADFLLSTASREMFFSMPVIVWSLLIALLIHLALTDFRRTFPKIMLLHNAMYRSRHGAFQLYEYHLEKDEVGYLRIKKLSQEERQFLRITDGELSKMLRTKNISGEVLICSFPELGVFDVIVFED